MTDAGVVLVSATVVFSVRSVYGQTFLAWAHGANHAGISASHSGLDAIGLLFTLLAIAWALAVLILGVVKRSRISAADWALVAVLVVCCGLRLVPYEQWKLLMVRANGTKHVPRNWVVSAAATGEIRLLEYLLANGVDVDTRAQYGQSPLAAAAAADQIEVAKMLIARGARLENRTIISSETPLTEAAQMNHTAMVKLLLDHGANPRARDATERTALDWAQKNRNSEMVSLLQAQSKE